MTPVEEGGSKEESAATLFYFQAAAKFVNTLREIANREVSLLYVLKK